MTDDNHVRHSRAAGAEIVQGDLKRAEREAANALRQTEVVRKKKFLKSRMGVSFAFAHPTSCS